jgi:hypothetical protein
MKCNRYGRSEPVVNRQKVMPQRQTTVISRTNYKAEMIASERNGKWEITTLNLDHNHDLEPHSSFFR